MQWSCRRFRLTHCRRGACPGGAPNGQRVDPCHDQLPDPIGKCIGEFREQIAKLEERIERLEREKQAVWAEHGASRD